MATIINADTSNGLKLTSDTSGEIELQSAGVTKAKITSNGLQNASGSAITSQAGRNLIINGNMGTSQRGTSFTGLTGISYNLDRWETTAYTMTGGQYQVDQSTDAPEGFAYSQKISCTTAHTQDVNNQFYIQQQIEGVNSSQLNYFVASPDTVTLSFWVKANLTGSYTCALKLSDNGSTENNTSTRVYNTTYSISSADTWEKKTVTIVLDSAVGDVQVVDNRFAVSVQWWLGAGTSRDGAAADSWLNYGNATTTADNLDLLGSTSNEWYITGVQLEATTGSATPFEHLQYGQQLALCQRYFQSSWSQGSAVGSAVSITTNSVQQSWGSLNAGIAGQAFLLPVTMRTLPTLVVYDMALTTGKVTTLGNGAAQTNNVSANNSATTTNMFYVRLYANSVAGLAFAYTLTAEL